MKEEVCKVPIQDDRRNFLTTHKKGFSNSKKVAVAAAILLLVAMALMIVFTFQSVNGMMELKQEVDYLKKSVEALQKEIQERKDSASVQEWGNDLDRRTVVDHFPPPLKIEDIQNVTDEYDYLDDYEETWYPEDYNYDNLEDESSFESLTGDQFTKDAKQATAPPRTKRSIIQYTQDGTPINSDGYPERRRNNTLRKNHFSTPPPSTYSNPSYPESRVPQDEEHTTPAPRQIHSSIHVHQGNRFQDYHQMLKSGERHFSQENGDAEFLEQPQGRTRHRQRRLELDDRHVRTGRMRPLPTAHFSGDTSKYVLGQHDNFNGNGHLRHPQRTFVDWAESNWFHALGMDRHFSLSDGVLTMKESGLYFIYAQIYYYDEHDINGFRVYRNENETLLQCTTMTHSVDRVMKGNTCFTAAAEYLNENDRISLGDLSESRYSLFEPGKSFFGVIKLGDVKIK